MLSGGKGQRQTCDTPNYIWVSNLAAFLNIKMSGAKFVKGHRLRRAVVLMSPPCIGTHGVPSNGTRAERFQQHHLWQGWMARSLRYYVESANLSWSCKWNVYIQTYGDRDRWQDWVTCGRAAQHCEQHLSVVLSRVKTVMDTLPGPQLCHLWKGQALTSHQAALRVTQCPQKHPGSYNSLACPKCLSCRHEEQACKGTCLCMWFTKLHLCHDVN